MRCHTSTPTGLCASTATTAPSRGGRRSWGGGVDAHQEGLRSAIGRYVFCLERNGVIRPWYVGKTLAAKGFAGEVFEAHKRRVYADVLARRRGTLLLFLFPLVTPETGRFSKSRATSRRVVDWLEITLMGFAHRKNPEISNVRDMGFLRNVEVLGLLGKRRGRPFREAQAVRRALLGSPNVGG